MLAKKPILVLIGLPGTREEAPTLEVVESVRDRVLAVPCRQRDLGHAHEAGHARAA